MHPLSRRVLHTCAERSWFGGDEWNDPQFEHYAELQATLGRAFAVPPATRTEIEAAARVVGPIPELYATLLCEVANGQWGPGYGIYGVPSGASKLDLDLVAEFQRWERADYPTAGFLPLCYWGCDVHSAMQMKTGRVVRFYMDSEAAGDEAPDLATWFTRWLDGEEMFDAVGGPIDAS